MGGVADLWGDGHDSVLGRLSLGKGQDILLRKMVLEACERGELGYAFRVALDGTHNYSSG